MKEAIERLLKRAAKMRKETAEVVELLRRGV